MMNPWSKMPEFVYLAVDKKKLLEEQKPFDGKKNCWIPDKKEGYLRALIESTKGEEVTVQIEDSTEVRIVMFKSGLKE